MAEQRPIDANALMDEVDRSEHDNPHADGMAKSTHRHEHRHFMAMISDAPTIGIAEEWISVAENLPEPFTNVLGCMTCTDGSIAVSECYRLIDTEFYFPALFGRHPVSHWMPMPEPPKMDGGAE